MTTVVPPATSRRRATGTALARTLLDLRVDGAHHVPAEGHRSSTEEPA